jgi:hypothetical protein
MLRIFLSLIILAVPACAAQPDAESSTASEGENVRVMVVGSYHFGNPGRDLNNVEADNVLSDRRQRELEVLAKELLAFRPTVIAVERTAEPPYDDPAWEAFTPEVLRADPDETVQIGYRLAGLAGTDRVYATDEYPSEAEQEHLPYGYFPYPPVAAMAEKTGRSDDLTRIADLSAFKARFEAAQTAATIPELLLIYNDEEGRDLLEAFYWDVVTFGEGEDQPGPELAAYWFLRNAKIFNKLAQVTKPGDRVVVVYGAGHGAWLRALAEKTNGYELEPVVPYLKRAAAQAE